ncbi:MAG: sigma 54-interacting transcriptional regulator [Deltaproteobacteria bacterium]|nr:sigma 54-interacting transcriptional regulator [Deltaproteobacteria bacterium]
MAGHSDDIPRTTEAIGAGTPLRATFRECRLTVVGGEHDGTVHVFTSPRVVVGADQSADIVLPDTTLSRFHCEIEIDRGTPIVRDLRSRNGTRIDHVPILEAPLRDGAILMLGRTNLRFDIGTRHIELRLSPRDRFGKLVGSSVAMRAVYALLEAAAGSDSTVLLQGESGTGKDLAAESVHVESARRDGPFVVVDCGAIPANLLEVELFGHEVGAFTGASSAHIGAFEAAIGGTIFLDEIGELALDLQPKLLRAIDRREIQRIGSNKRIPIDVRVVAASNRNLKEEVNARRFRSDLYFRLAVLVVTMPPLRDRTGDIPALVVALLDLLGDRASPMAKALDGGELLPELLRHAWPGNVRELRNYLEGCLVRQDSAQAAVPAGEPVIDIARPLREVRDRWVRHVEQRYLERLLAAHGGNVSAAARAAGVDRVHLHRLLVKHGLR